MRGVEMLARLRGPAVRKTLEGLLASEKDAEIQRAAEKALNAQAR